VAGSGDGFGDSVLGFATVVFESAGAAGLSSNFSTEGAGFGAAEPVALVGVTVGRPSDVWSTLAAGVCVPAGLLDLAAAPEPSAVFELVPLTAPEFGPAFAAFGLSVAVVPSGLASEGIGVAPAAPGLVALAAVSAGFGGTDGNRSARMSMARIGPA
jgi:hypothetical protein